MVCRLPHRDNMGFTYHLALTDTISQLRLEIGDTSPESGQGVKPDGNYYHDEELTYFLTKEGSLGCAAAAVCEALARAWTKIASASVGPLSEQQGEIAAKFSAQARTLRDQYGYGDTAMTTSAGLTAGVINHGFAEIDSTDEYA